MEIRRLLSGWNAGCLCWVSSTPPFFYLDGEGNGIISLEFPSLCVSHRSTRCPLTCFPVPTAAWAAAVWSRACLDSDSVCRGYAVVNATNTDTELLPVYQHLRMGLKGDPKMQLTMRRLCVCPLYNTVLVKVYGQLLCLAHSTIITSFPKHNQKSHLTKTMPTKGKYFILWYA